MYAKEGLSVRRTDVRGHDGKMSGHREMSTDDDVTVTRRLSTRHDRIITLQRNVSLRTSRSPCTTTPLILWSGYCSRSVCVCVPVSSHDYF